MPTLYKLPLGTTIIDQFVNELVGEEDSLLILPNRYQMEKVKFSQVPCTGIDTLANRILNENGYINFEQINRRTQELVIEDLINYMHEVGHFTYFDKLYDKPGFLKSMTSFIGQLANTGLSEQEIKEHFHIWEEETKRTELQVVKDKEVFTLYGLYRNRLKEENWYDLEGKYRLAVYLLKKEGTKIPWRKIRIFGFYTLDKLQIDLFYELSKHLDISIAMYYGEGEIYKACRDTYNSLLNFCTEQVYMSKQVSCIGKTLVENIFKDNSIAYSSTLSIDGLSLASFASRDKEIRYVFTEIKKLILDGKSPKDIILIVRNLDNFNGLGAVAQEYGLPISLGRTCKLSAHPIFGFIKLLYQATLENHDGAEAYFKLLKNKFGSSSWGNLGIIVNKLREEKYFSRSSQAREEVQSLVSEENESLLKTNQYLSSLQNKQTIESHADTLIDYIKSFNVQESLGNDFKKGEISIEALKSTLEAYKQLLSCIEMVCNDYKLCGREQETMYPMKWLEILTESASMINISLSHGRVDGVRVMEAANMQGLNYKYVFLLGLRNGEFPVTNNENWIYSDKERIALNMDLPTTSSSFAEDAYFFAASIACASEFIMITYHAEDDGDKSPYVDELRRIFLTKEDEKFISNLPIQKPEEKTLASFNEVFEKYGPGVDTNNIDNYIHKENINFALHCADMEKESSHAHFHGKLNNEQVIESAKEKIGNTFSASSLNKYMSCPYAFLMDKVLNLGDGSVKEEEGGPAENGTVIHNTLSGFLNEHLMEKLLPEHLEIYERELDEIYETVWVDFIAKGLVNNSSLWQSEKPRIRKLLHNWLYDEINNQQLWDYLPMATELQFFDGKTNSRIDLQLWDGTNVKLQGAIDRIDSNGDKLFITDYKLSVSSVPNQTAIAEGEDMQLNVYLLAAEKLFGNKIAGGGYYVIKGLTRKPNLLLDEVGLIKATKANKSFAEWNEFSSTAKNVIVALIERIYKGDFAPSGENCTYCPYGDICRKNEGLPEKEENDA